MTFSIGIVSLSEEVFSIITLFLIADDTLALSYTCIHSYSCLSRDNVALWRRYLEAGRHRVRPQAGTTCSMALSIEPSNYRLIVAALARSDWRFRKEKITKLLKGGHLQRRFYPTNCRKDLLLRVDPICLKEFAAKQRGQCSTHRRSAFPMASCERESANSSILTRLVTRGDEGSLRRILKRIGDRLSTVDRVRAVESALAVQMVTAEMAACVCMVLDSHSMPALVKWSTPPGDTALHVASRFGHSLLVQRLMAALDDGDTMKALVNRRNLLGETAAHVALDGNHISIATMLVEKYGCNSRIADQAGRTVMSMMSRFKDKITSS